MGCNRPILLHHTSRDSFPKHNGDDLAVEKARICELRPKWKAFYDLLIKGIYPLVNSNISMDHPHSQQEISAILHAALVYQQLLEIHHDEFTFFGPTFTQKGAPGLTRRRCKNNRQTSPLPAVTNRGPRKVSPVEL